MRTRVFYLLAAMGLLAGCAKETDTLVPSPEKGKFVLSIGLPETKTHMGALDGTKRKVYWSDGDQVAVNGTASDKLAGIAEGTSSTEFTFSTEPSTPYNVLYPASIYTSATTVTLPATQAYAEGGFAEGVLPMAGYSASGNGVMLGYLCALLKVSVKQAASGDADNLLQLRFYGNADEQVSGVFSINYEDATLAATSSAQADKYVRVEQNLATSTSAAVDYYVAVPAGTYSAGFSVKLQDVNGHYMVKSRTSSVTLEAGHMYKLDEFDFVPTGTELGVEISNAEDLIGFAAAYNNKDYETLGNALRVKLTADIAFDATTSAAFNATGGIGLKTGSNGTEDYYFDGLFDGNGKTISGLAATKPLFVATSSNANIKDLTLGNTCSFVFTHANTGEGMFGSIVGYHKGELSNVKSAADVSLAEVDDDVTYMTTLGGLAGRVTTGVIANGSEYSGLISAPAGFTATKKLLIGGLVGRFSNAGSIQDSFFKGAISNEAQITSTDKTNPYLVIGGIAGYVDGGASISSTNTTADHADVESAKSGFNGTIVNKTTVAYNSAVGGIVGELNKGTVSDCTNAATIAISIFKVGADGSASSMNARALAGSDTGVKYTLDANFEKVYDEGK